MVLSVSGRRVQGRGVHQSVQRVQQRRQERRPLFPVRRHVPPSGFLTVRRPHTIGSSRGVQQADPLAPAFFALAIDLVIKAALHETQQAFPGGIDTGTFYLGDGLLAGEARAVSFLLNRLTLGFGPQVAREKTLLTPACRSLPGHSFTVGLLRLRLGGQAPERPCRRPGLVREPAVAQGDRGSSPACGARPLR